MTLPEFVQRDVPLDHLNTFGLPARAAWFATLAEPTTGASLGTVMHAYGALAGMEFVGATLYATFHQCSGCSSNLVTVNTATDSLAIIGPTGFGLISGLAYDEAAGVMYGVTAGGAPAQLVTINLATGAATVVGPTGLDRVGSIEFGPDGNLYGGVTLSGTTNPGYLVRINKATGAATPVGDTGFSITGLTSCKQAQLPPPRGAPAVSGWGLLLTALRRAGLAAAPVVGILLAPREIDEELRVWSSLPLLVGGRCPYAPR